MCAVTKLIYLFPKRSDCIPTLIKDSPDTVIIHTGTNDLRNKENEEIIKSIRDIVEICGRHGVTLVFDTFPARIRGA